MLCRTWLSSLFIISSGFSLGLDDIIDKTMQNSYDLQKIEKNIHKSKENTSLSELWENPNLTFGINDMQLANPLERNKEAMQALYIAITQVIPTNGKLTYLKNMAINDEQIAQMDLENKKLQLTATLSQIVYKIAVNQKKLALIESYQKNTQDLENFALKLYENGRAQQITALNAGLLNSKLKIQKENIKYSLKKSYLQLEQISYEKISFVDEPLDVKYISLVNIDISEHPLIKSLRYTREKYSNKARLEEAKKISDVKFNIGYFNRAEKFKDYVSLSFTMGLPLWGRENINIAKARYEVSQVRDSLEITQKSFEQNLKTLDEEMQKSYSNYKTLSDNMTQQREFIEQNVLAHTTLGHTNSIELLQNINETFELDMLALDELEKYYTAYAKSFYFGRIHK